MVLWSDDFLLMGEIVKEQVVVDCDEAVFEPEQLHNFSTLGRDLVVLCCILTRTDEVKMGTVATWDEDSKGGVGAVDRCVLRRKDKLVGVIEETERRDCSFRIDLQTHDSVLVQQHDHFSFLLIHLVPSHDSLPFLDPAHYRCFATTQVLNHSILTMSTISLS